MYDTNLLLISQDASLHRTVQKSVASVARLGLTSCASVEDARARLAEEQFALLVAHCESAAECQAVAGLMREIALLRRPMATLIIDDGNDADQALQLMRLGAADVLERPLNIRRLAYLLDVLTIRTRLAPPAEVTAAAEDLPDALPAGLADEVLRVAPQDTMVLLLGETGSGKTRLARILHGLSPRRDKPFVVVSCGALSGTLIESELFGHARGAFTGADRDRAGKFAEAGAGTLLLDDVEALTLEMQAKLLRAIEERVFEPVGSNRVMPIAARVLSASNRPLDRDVAAGRFRADLYYRLNVVSLALPPLRECRDELPRLAARFVDEFAGATGQPVRGIDPAAMAVLRRHSWPGNVRELRNVIERAVVLCRGDCIRTEDLPASVRENTIVPSSVAVPVDRFDPAPVRDRTLAAGKEAAERTQILESLARNRNNRRRAAAELGISRMTLYKKLHRYSLIDACG